MITFPPEIPPAPGYRTVRFVVKGDIRRGNFAKWLFNQLVQREPCRQLTGGRKKWGSCGDRFELLSDSDLIEISVS